MSARWTATRWTGTRWTGTRRAAVLAIVGALMAVGASACGDDDDSSGQGESVFALGVGQCFDTFEATTEVSEVPTVPCAEPHTYEVFAVFDLEGSEYPGLDEVERLAYDGCLERFEAFVGVPYEASTFEFSNLYPLEQGWNEAADREVVCFVFNPDRSPLTGSVQGAAR